MHAGKNTCERTSRRIQIYKKVLKLNENLLISKILEMFQKILESFEQILENFVKFLENFKNFKEIFKLLKILNNK